MIHNRLVRLKGVLVGVAIGCIMGAALHETGHAVVALAYGREIRQVRVGPFLTIYPVLEFGSINLDLGEVKQAPPKSQHEEGLRDVAGSGLTAIIAIILLALFRPAGASGLVKTIVSVASLVLSWDIISYSTFPLLGWRHWIVLGGIEPEPVIGADLLGVVRWVYYVGLAIYAAIVNWLSFRLWVAR